MRMSYFGANETCEFRTAVIDFKESEFDKLVAIKEEMYENGYDFSIVDECAICEVNDREEYEVVKEVYMDAKRELQCK